MVREVWSLLKALVENLPLRWREFRQRREPVYVGDSWIEEHITKLHHS